MSDIKWRKIEAGFSMAKDDLEGAEADFHGGRFPSSVFHAQQCCEKIIKGILLYFGIEAGFTRFPVELLRREVFKRELTDEIRKGLLEIIKYSRALEEQKAMLRYGWETVEKIITPREIYDAEKAKSLLENARYVFRLANNIIKVGD
ncbi:MAG: HEPN domain-containing protein [Promethearchaeota archaeon]